MKNWSGFYSEMVSRNIGVISAEEQEKLRSACVSVAGCGGIGGLSAEQFVRLGVGHIKIADFDNFEIHNLSRQCGSTTLNVGKHKAEVLENYFKAINPELKIDVFKKGVQAENADEFVKGSQIVIDGIDYTAFYNTVILHRAARKKNLCVISSSAIGLGASIIVFGPNTVSIEEYVGLPPGSSEEAIRSFNISIEKFAPYFPSYGNKEIALKAAMGKINIPNIMMPQHLGTSIGVTEAVMILLGRVSPPKGPAPRIFVVDLQDRKFEVTG